jgi:hypothetical protein
MGKLFIHNTFVNTHSKIEKKSAKTNHPKTQRGQTNGNEKG